jgi:hypothetical protein
MYTCFPLPHFCFFSFNPPQIIVSASEADFRSLNCFSPVLATLRTNSFPISPLLLSDWTFEAVVVESGLRSPGSGLWPRTLATRWYCFHLPYFHILEKGILYCATLNRDRTLLWNLSQVDFTNGKNANLFLFCCSFGVDLKWSLTPWSFKISDCYRAPSHTFIFHISVLIKIRSLWFLKFQEQLHLQLCAL